MYHLKKILNKNEVFPGIESLSPLFYSQLETLFDYLPSKHLLVIDNEKNVENRADNFFKEVFMEYELSTKQNKLSLLPESLFLSNRELKLLLRKNANVILNSKINNKSDRIVHQLNFINNLFLRSGFEKSKANSALGL